MKSLPVRIVIFLLFVVTVFVAGYRLLDLQQQASTNSKRQTAFDASLNDILVSVSDLRAAQQAYIADGQEGTFWITRVELIQKTILDGLTRLTSLASSDKTAESLSAATTAMSDFSKMDKHVTEYRRNGHRLMASDLIFTEGQEMTNTTAKHLRVALTQEQELRASVDNQRLRDQTATILGAAAVGLLTSLLLLPFGRPTVASTAEFNANQPLDIAKTLDGSTTPPLVAKSAPSTALTEIAELCSDFSRVTDTDTLPALLRRASGLINGAKIVVWLADPTGVQLRPVLAHGYRAEMLEQLGVIKTDGDNATAAAFREGTSEIVSAGTNDDSRGALIVPIFTGLSCMGVVTAEFKNGEESDEKCEAVTKIIAAQLASLVPSPARAQAAHDVKHKRLG